MNTTSKKAAAGLLALMTLSLSSMALATNGYFTHGIGAESKGMAGTGIGSASFEGPIVSAANPALAVFASDSWEVGLSFFSPRRTYVASPSLANGNGGAFTIGAGEFDSSSEWFPIPYVAKNWKLNNDRILSVAFYGRGGMNTDWDTSAASATFDPTGTGAPPVTSPGPFGAGPAGVDLSQAFLSVNYVGKTSERFSWGIGPVFAIQAFEAEGVGSFAPFTRTFASSIVGGGGPVPVNNLTNNGHEISTGWGVSGGIWFALSDNVSAGLAYQSKLSMSELDDYSDLFAEGGGFDIPSSLKGGISFVANDQWRINVDIEHSTFSDVDAVGNSLTNIGGCPTAGLGGMDVESCLGGGNGAGFGWEDMTTYKLGAEWHQDSSNTWRFGYSYGEQPIQSVDALFNILAPGVMEQHLTAGWTHRRSNGDTLTFSLMYAPEKSVTGPNLFDPTQTIELKMNQFEFEVSYLW